MDLTAIQTALGLAGAAITTTGQAATTAEAIKKLFSSGKSSDDEGVKLVNSLASQLTTANIMNVQLSEALKTVNNEIREQDEFEKEKSRYTLFRTPEGDMVLRLKPDMSEGQPDHFICPVCLRTSKLIMYITGEGDYKICQNDRSHAFRFSFTPPPSLRDQGWELA